VFTKIELAILAGLTLSNTTMMVEATHRQIIEAPVVQVAAMADVAPPQTTCLAVSPTGELMLAYAVGYGAMAFAPPEPCAE
jgi:MFS superfamily sulfate permease-like transporter